MSSHKNASLSLVDKAKFTGVVALIVFETWLKFVTRLLDADKVQPWKKRVICYFLGSHHVPNFPPRYLRAILPTTGQVIRDFCAAKSLLHNEVVISAGEKHANATLHFIDETPSPQQSGPIILYFHGGGYHNPSSQGPLLVATSCAKHAGARLAMLEYSLAPEAPYPTQLVQAVAALRYVLVNRKPNDVVLMGDSSGGHLILSLLAHGMSQSPYAPPVALGTDKESKLGGALLISPWVSTDYRASTYDVNCRYDFLHREQMQRFTEFWQPKEEEVWANPSAKGAEFWAQAPVSRIMITTGTWEVFYSDIVAMAERLRVPEDKQKLRLVESSQDVHVSVLLEAGLQLPESSTKRAILDWMEKL